MFSGLHMETKKKIARILKASGLQTWMDGVAVCWDREQSRSARPGQSVDKDAYFQQGAKDANQPCGLRASGHWMQSTQRSSGPETVSGTHLWPRSVSATLLPPFPDCVWVLSSENRFYYFLFVCFPLADISHVQCPALGSASGMLEWAVTETEMIQHHLGEERGCQTLLECDSCTKVAVLSESEGAPWTRRNTDTLSRGADFTGPQPPFPKPGRIWSPKSTLLLKKCILTTRQRHCPQEWNALISIYRLSSAGTGVFTNSCNWWILNSPDTSLQGRLHSMTVSSTLPLFSLHVVHAHKWLWKYYVVDNPYQDLKKSRC